DVRRVERMLRLEDEVPGPLRGKGECGGSGQKKSEKEGLAHMEWFGARGRGRTGTSRKEREILSLVRLPIPPLGRRCASLATDVPTRHPVGARLQRGDGVDHAQSPVAVAGPVDLHRGVCLLHDRAYETDERAHAPRRGVADRVAYADAFRAGVDRGGVELLHVF